ncbi:hypothetical protein AWENTII_004980, partial [Aspergillus wentii]
FLQTQPMFIIIVVAVSVSLRRVGDWLCLCGRISSRGKTYALHSDTLHTGTTHWMSFLRPGFLGLISTVVHSVLAHAGFSLLGPTGGGGQKR